MHDHGVLAGADDARDLISDRHRHVPPAFGPRAHTPRRPTVGVLVQSFVRCPRHRAETVRNEVDSLVQDRKLRTIFEKVVSQSFSFGSR